MPQASKRSHPRSARLVLQGSIHRLPRFLTIRHTRRIPCALPFPSQPRLPILLTRTIPRLLLSPFFLLAFLRLPFFLLLLLFLLHRPHSTLTTPLQAPRMRRTRRRQRPHRAARFLRVYSSSLRLSSHPLPIDSRDSSAARDAADRVEDAPNYRCSAWAAPQDCAPAIRPSNHTRHRSGFAANYGMEARELFVS